MAPRRDGLRPPGRGRIGLRSVGLPFPNDGTLTPRGVFFRSENVDRVTPLGWDQTHDAGIRTVVDLRQEGGRRTASRAPAG
ncbi:tyrosine-protein phosphatase [Lacisediminihabitans profunda]|uniref:Tyrosine-protein phosphatase n=1 Tax=Lacisediminihabitans profunda TaxID=2594790 RepID=A0A5C8UNF6_9MICO|nr:tyrosine-protein phosphatase [Lacisediminihabitans profunda]